MGNAVKILSLLGLFIFSFVLFLFMTFPYEVLKEQISAQISQSAGMQLRIGQLGPSLLPLGLSAGDVKISSPNGMSQVQLKSLDVDVGVLSLLIGNLHIGFEAEAGKGNIEGGLDFPLGGLASGAPLPSRVTMESKAFPLDPFIDFALNMVATAPGANPMVAPLLSALGVSAQLNSKLDFDLDSKNPTQSKGNLEIQLAQAVLKLSHPSLGLPDQTFKKALIKAKVENGTLVLDKNSGIVSDELQLTPEGKITLKPDPQGSLLDLKVGFKLDKGLKEKFGFLMDAFTGGQATDGALTMQVRGPVSQPAISTF